MLPVGLLGEHLHYRSAPVNALWLLSSVHLFHPHWLLKSIPGLKYCEDPMPLAIANLPVSPDNGHFGYGAVWNPVIGIGPAVQIPPLTNILGWPAQWIQSLDQYSCTARADQAPWFYIFGP